MPSRPAACPDPDPAALRRLRPRPSLLALLLALLLAPLLGGCVAPEAAPAPPEPIAGPPPTASVQPAGRPFFCAALQPPPAPPPYCTRSLGAVDCWTRPPLTLPPRPNLADGRARLTEAQEARRTQCWPGLF